MLYSYIHFKLNVKLYFTNRRNIFKLQYIVSVGDLGFVVFTLGVGDLNPTHYYT